MGATVKDYRNALIKALGRKEVLQEQEKAINSKMEKLQRDSLAIEKLQVIIQETAKQTQEQLKYHIEDIVRTCMETVFDDTYDFKFDIEIKRNKTEANLRFIQENEDVDIMNSSGGGCVDVASLGLKLAAWSLGNSNNVMVLDESLKFLSKDLQLLNWFVSEGLPTVINFVTGTVIPNIER